MITKRAEERRKYWEKKHQKPMWPQDIHFAIFPDNRADAGGFIDGVTLNTNQVLYDMEERLSLFGMMKGVRVLDLGCGCGDLLLAMCRFLPGFHGIGIDVASTAVKQAQDRLNDMNGQLKGSVDFRTGGVEVLTSLAGNANPFDLIIIRDSYYLLSEQEQGQLWGDLPELLKKDGMVYIADLAVHQNHEDAIAEPLIERQLGGRPIRWWWHADQTRSFSVDGQAEAAGFVRAGREVVNEWSVRDSYRAASRMYGNGSSGTAYATLAEIADQRVAAAPILPYVRLWYERKVMQTAYLAAPPASAIGLKVKVTLEFREEQPIIQKGDWLLPRHKWLLLVGRSGVGKSTFLKYLAGWSESKVVERVGVDSDRIFVLSQEPELLEELTVEENLKLFRTTESRSDSGTRRYDEIVKMLGFDPTLLNRRADDSLSGGERQRVALGQALIADPELLILDEPFSGVDQARKVHLLQKFRELQRVHGWDGTVLCVDHDFPAVARFFDYVFELRQGKIFEVAR